MVGLESGADLQRLRLELFHHIYQFTGTEKELTCTVCTIHVHKSMNTMGMLYIGSLCEGCECR